MHSSSSTSTLLVLSLLSAVLLTLSPLSHCVSARGFDQAAEPDFLTALPAILAASYSEPLPPGFNCQVDRYDGNYMNTAPRASIAQSMTTTQAKAVCGTTAI